MKRVHVIGSGNAFSSSGRRNACYIFEPSRGEPLLVDFGATSLLGLNQESHDPGSFNSLLLTHFHGDHYGGVPFLILHLGILAKRDRPFTIYGPAGVESAVSKLMEVLYPGFDWRSRGDLRFVEISTSPVTIQGMVVEPYPQLHRPESLGYRITGPDGRTVSFSGDATFDENLFLLTRGSDLAILECTMERQTDPPTEHITLEEIRNGLKELGAKRILLTHIYDELARIAVERGMECAEDGMIVEI